MTRNKKGLIKFKCVICRKEVITKDERRKTCGGKCSRIRNEKWRKEYNIKWRKSKRGKEYIKKYNREHKK